MKRLSEKCCILEFLDSNHWYCVGRWVVGVEAKAMVAVLVLLDNVPRDAGKKVIWGRYFKQLNSCRRKTFVLKELHSLCRYESHDCRLTVHVHVQHEDSIIQLDIWGEKIHILTIITIASDTYCWQIASTPFPSQSSWLIPSRNHSQATYLDRRTNKLMSSLY